jgi:chromosome segregation ATPase
MKVRIPNSAEKIKEAQEARDTVSSLTINTGDSRGPGWTARRKKWITDQLEANASHMVTLSNKIEELRTAHFEDEAGYQQVISDLEERVHDLAEKNTQLQKQFQKGQKGNNEQQMEREILAELQRRYDNLERSHVAATTDNYNLRNQCKDLTQENERLKAENARLQKSNIDAANRDISKLGSFTNERDNLQLRYNDLAHKKALVDARVLALEALLDARTPDLTQHNKELAEDNRILSELVRGIAAQISSVQLVRKRREEKL